MNVAESGAAAGAGTAAKPTGYRPDAVAASRVCSGNFYQRGSVKILPPGSENIHRAPGSGQVPPGGKHRIDNAHNPDGQPDITDGWQESKMPSACV